MKKRIALFIGSLVSEYQSQMTATISRTCKGRFNLDVFSNVGGYAGSYFYKEGTESVINIPALEDYDGIIVSPDSLETEGIYNMLVDRIEKEAHCPVVSVRCRDERYHNILIDNAEAMEYMIRHLILVHGLRNICFMTGRLDLEDARCRLDSYKKIMAEYNLPITEHMIFEGDYWKLKGEEAVNWFMSGSERPEAIVCANDYMAVSVANALKKRNIRIPDDIAVTGFDNIDDVKVYEPRIASMEVSNTRIGEAAVDVLERLINGEDVPQNTYVPVTAHFEGSCGCPCHRGSETYRELFTQKAYLENAIEQTTYMNSDYEACISVEELLLNVFRYSFSFDYEKMYFCQCENVEWMDDDDIDKNIVFSSNMILKGILDAQANRCDSYNMLFPRRDLIPRDMWVDDETRIVFAVRSRNSSLGYFVLKTDSVDRLERFFVVWVQTFAAAFDRIRMMSRNEAYMRFKEESRLDSLTGLFNRREMENILRRRRVGADTGDFFIMMMDMDGLKKINDNYGHQAGDEALITLAGILKDISSDEIKVARTGGDEFTICAIGKEIELPKRIAANLRERIADYNSRKEVPYEISVSIGYARFIKCPNGVAQCIAEADRRMYEDKATKKNKRDD